MSRVFMPILNDKDVSGVATYGEPVFVMSQPCSPFNTDRVCDVFCNELESAGFDPDKDYVALTGPMVFVALFYAQALARFGKLKTLMFDAASHRYVERIVRAGRR